MIGSSAFMNAWSIRKLAGRLGSVPAVGKLDAELNARASSRIARSFRFAWEPLSVVSKQKSGRDNVTDYWQDSGDTLGLVAINSASD